MKAINQTFEQPGAAKEVFSWIAKAVAGATHRVRRIPSSDAALNLEDSLARIQDDFTAKGHIGYRVFVNGDPKPLNSGVRDEVYRIGREAVINAFEHARATDVEVEADYSPKRLRILIRDNGRAIDPRVVQCGGDERRGLMNMHERAARFGAQLRVWSSSIAGTEIEVAVPGTVAFSE